MIINDKLKTCVNMMLDKGCEMSAIKNSYLENLDNEDDLDTIILFMKNNPSCSYKEISHEVHRIGLKKSGIII